MYMYVCMWAETQAGISAASRVFPVDFFIILPKLFSGGAKKLCKMPRCWLLEEVEDWWLFFSSAFGPQYSVPCLQWDKELGSSMEKYRSSPESS